MDYGAILQRSWDLTKRHKWLWVYGLVLAVFGGGGMNGIGGSGGGSSSSTPSGEEPRSLPEKTSQVLGAATDAIGSWLSSVPVATWVLLGTLLFLLVIVSIILAAVIRSWATGALIAGLADADGEKEVTLASTSGRGVAAIWPLVKLGIISFALTLSGLIAGMAFIGLGYLLFSFSQVAQTVWLILSILAIGVSSLVLLALFAITGIYADRLVVLSGASSWAAWKQGLRLSWRHFWQTLVMGVINSTIGCAVGCLAIIVLLVFLGVPAILLVVPLFRDGFHWPSPAVIVALAMLVFIFIYLNLALSAVLVVFRYGTWNVFFREIMSKEQKTENNEQ